MCRIPSLSRTIMVTPTKVKSHHHHHQSRSHQQQPHHHRGKGWTPPPPSNNKQQQHQPQRPQGYRHSPQPSYSSYNSSSQSGASTPNRGSPCFAGSKCFEPPTPDSLPKPPTSWTPTKPAKKQLNFDCTTSDVIMPPMTSPSTADAAEAANQHLRMLLNVQA